MLIVNEIDIDLHSSSVSESVSISIVIISHYSIVFVVMLFGLWTLFNLSLLKTIISFNKSSSHLGYVPHVSTDVAPRP